MDNIDIIKPFNSEFLNEFIFVPQNMPFTEKEVIDLDKSLNQYEKVFLDPDIENNLISKNELLASFAISKAENSDLTLKEAKEVYEIVKISPNLDFIREKINSGKKLTKGDYEKLEFFNIAKTFRELNINKFKIEDLTPEIIKDIHKSLTLGMDIFANKFLDFTIYRSGEWRNNNEIVAGNYSPADFNLIPGSIKILTDWLKDNFSLNNITIFHTALYALHPFNNGNKRVCRILEHILFRELGLNINNLYSSSYYYHKEKERYYKYLLFSLERKNFNHFASFILEAIVLSIIDVLKTSIEVQRDSFVRRQTSDKTIILITKPLVKRNKLQYKNLFKKLENKISNKTFVNYLQEATSLNIVKRREVGQNVFYSLNYALEEEKTLSKWIEFASMRLKYIPDEYKVINT